MDKRMLTIILAIALIAAFFLDWGGGSGLDAVQSKYGDWQKYIPILIPLSGVLLLIGAMNNGNYPLGRNTLAWLPLLTVLFILFIGPLIRGADFGALFKSLGKGWGIGWWITVVVSLVLALYNPRK